MLISKRIKLLLVVNNLTVTDLAQKCELFLGKKVYREQVSLHIHGHRYYPELNQPIANELGVNIAQLIGKEKIEIIF
jgi:hypothetical protein